jgi:hypothetical protein
MKIYMYMYNMNESELDMNEWYDDDMRGIKRC